MQKKILTIALLLASSLATCPVSHAYAAEQTSIEEQSYKCNPEDSIFNSIPEPDQAGEIIKEDICIAPAKKTINVGRSFSISFKADPKGEYSWLSKEEFNAMLMENVDSITYRSTNSSIAYVNKYTGRVSGRRPGYAVIRTYVNLSSGESAIFKTKVYVTNS